MQRSLSTNLRRLFAYREVLWALLVRDVKVRYKQTGLGVMWALLQPVSQALVFSMVATSLGSNGKPDLPSFIFVYAGVLPWNLFANSVALGGTSVAGHASLLTKVDFPREVIPLATVLVNVMDYGVGLLILLVLLPLFHVPFHLSLLLLPVALLLELGFSCAIVLFLSGVNVFYRDVRYVIPLATILWFFMTPVFYAAERMSGTAGRLVPWNPVAWIVELHRAMITGHLDDAGNLMGLLAMVSAAMLLVAYQLFKRWEPRFADVI